MDKFNKHAWLFSSGILCANAGWSVAAHEWLASAGFALLSAGLMWLARGGD